jgi:acetyl esterase/lipase
MKRINAVAIFALLLSAAISRGADPITVDLWPAGKAPGQTAEPASDTVNSKNGNVRLTNITRPQIVIYPVQKEKNTGTALIIAPGGGFRDLGWTFEGETMAKWCNERGVTGIILKYRVPSERGNAVGAFQDGQRAVSLVRGRANEWNIDPKRIGMIGFSAGGSVANYVILNSDKTSVDAVDEYDKDPPRLDFGVLIYSAGAFGSRDGKNSFDSSAVSKEKIPPLFFAAAFDDNIASTNTLQSVLALKKAGVATELHLYATGGHGFGYNLMNPPVPLVGDWSHRLEDWMRYQKLLDTKKIP